MQPILVYYWLTPAFWLADAFLGANFSLAAVVWGIALRMRNRK